ncbi:MAG: substrate-binding domain-containing protein [Dethiobacteria bacterium]|jgi:tungstate transport system substrate-binding protein
MDKDLQAEFKVSLDLEGEKRISASDLFNLLENIMLAGSISRAATQLGISYRYSWGLLREAEKALGLALVDKQIGGYAGGGTTLTREGKALLQQYKAFQQEVESQLERYFSEAPPLKHGVSGGVLNGKIKPGEGEETVAESLEEVAGRHLLMATTMEPVETGLMDVLEQAFYQTSRVLVRHIAVGSGRALEIARKGRVDLVLSHAPELEESFMQEGWGLQKIPVMANDFILIGPAADPAEIGQLNESAGTAGAFRQIAARKVPFISRGDYSGTHIRELSLWQAAGVTPSGDWYLTSPGVAGNLGLVRLAVQKQAYALVDRATYLISRGEKKLKIFVGTEEKSALSGELENVSVLIVVNPKYVSAGNFEDASLFTRWLAGGKGREIISHFGRSNFGRPLFSLPGNQ